MNGEKLENIHDLYRALGGRGTYGAAGSYPADLWQHLPAVHSEVFRTGEDTRYLKKPGVVMLSAPHFDPAGMQRFLDDFGEDFGDYLKDSELRPAAGLIKTAGQICYMSLGEGRTRNRDAGRYLEHILSSGHGSVLEHAQFSFLLYGVSRSFTHELVRHRAGVAFSQVSQRYVSGKVLRFVERPEYQADPDLHRRFETRIDSLSTEYAQITTKLAEKQQTGDQLLSGDAKTELRKKVQQCARSVLPNETEAPIVFSGNIRALRHIIEMRANQAAEIEIRAVQFRVFLCMAIMEPLLFADYEIVTLPDGTHAVSTKYRKV